MDSVNTVNNPFANAENARNMVEQNGNSLKDSLKDIDAFLSGGGMSGAAAANTQLPVLSGAPAPAADASADSASSLGLSGPAKIFQQLGVDPNAFQLNMKRDEVNFKLAMDDDQMRTDTQGNVDYRGRSINLEIHMSSASGTVDTGNGQVQFEKLQFDMSFSYDEASAGQGTGSRGGAQDAFGKKIDEFMKAVMDEVGKLFDNGDLAGDPEAMQAFAENVGKKLTDLMGGVMQAGAEDTSNSTYKAPQRALPAASNKLDEMQNVADQLTQQAAAMAEEQPSLADQGIPVADASREAESTGAASAEKTTPWKAADTSVLDLLSKPKVDLATDASAEAPKAEEPKAKQPVKPSYVPSPAARAFESTKPQAQAQKGLNLVA